jgi:hypothetical protein
MAESERFTFDAGTGHFPLVRSGPVVLEYFQGTIEDMAHRLMLLVGRRLIRSTLHVLSEVKVCSGFVW